MINILKISMKNFLIYLFIAYNIFVAIFSLSEFPEQLNTSEIFPYLCDKPVGEDAFYMLTIAWNLAEGSGLVYNYNEATTGIQPLTTFIYGMLAWVIQAAGYDKWDFTRIVFLFNVLIIFLFYYSIKSLLKKVNVSHDNSLLLLLLILFNFNLYRTFTYGLETGLYLFLFALCIISSYNLFIGNKNNYKILFFGLAAGLCVLVRIDFAVILLVFLLINLITKKLKIKEVLLIGLITGFIASPWFIYVYISTNSIIPSSGSAQAQFVQFEDLFSRPLSMFVAIITNFFPLIYTGGKLPVALAAIIILLAVIFYNFKQNQQILLQFKSDNFKQLFVWGLSVMPLLIVYILFFWAAHFYIRYSAPLLIFATVLIFVFVNDKLNKKSSNLILAIIMVITFFMQAYYSFHLGRVGNTHTVSAGFIKSNFPTIKVGSFQSGVIGYFNSNVVNLDGKINKDALLALRQNKLDEFVDKEKIDVLIDWPSVISSAFDSAYLKEKWIEYNQSIGNDISVCLVRKNISQ